MGTIDINSSEYPDSLKDLTNPPPHLHFEGVWDSSLFNKSLSVTGTRRASRYGQYVTSEIIGTVCTAGITVIAGLMTGIDRIALETSLQKGRRCIAVAAGGTSRSFAGEEELFKKRFLGEGGLLISPYSDDTFPALGCFHKRNKILTALSPLLLVVEGGRNSGALKVAGEARNCSRKIFAVPGQLTSPGAIGTALLIRDGATILIEPSDILREYGIVTSEREERFPEDDLKDVQKRIVRLLSSSPMSIDEITRTLRLTAAECGAELSKLCLRKIIHFSDGRYFKGKHYAD